MQWIASGFLFVRGRTWFHMLDPRARLFLTASMFTLALASHVLELLVLIGITCVLVASAKIFRRFSKSMVFAIGLGAFTFVLDYYLLPQKPDPFVIALTYALRLFAVVSVSSLYFLTTTPDELELVMKWLKFPSDFVMIFVIAVRFVPVLLLDALQIMDAQRSRGLEFDKGGLMQRARNTIPLLVPLIAVAVNRSLDLAEAMDSRAYGAVKRTTSLYSLKFRSVDYSVSLTVLAMGALGFYIVLFTSLANAV
jgi:energy-coupling factor transport system permease protein